MSGNVEHISPCFSCGHVCPIEKMLKVCGGEKCDEQYNMKTGFVRIPTPALGKILGYNTRHTFYCSFDDNKLKKKAKKHGYELLIEHVNKRRFYYARELNNE